MPILLAKNSMLARQIDKFAPLHTLKSVVVNPKTDCQFEKNGFLTELKYICCKLGPFCVKFHLGQSRTNPLL